MAIEIRKRICGFDQQDSGNLSFGVERDGHKKFIKYAGARTIAYEGTMKDAIERLKVQFPYTRN